MISTCYCQQCQTPIEFDPTEAGISGATGSFGKTVMCPSCGKPTPLIVAKRAPRKSGVPPLVMTVGVAVLVATLCVVFGAGAFLAILWGISTFIYFVPAILGWRKRNFVAILALNFFLGWTLLGWVGALVWALTKDPAQVGTVSKHAGISGFLLAGASLLAGLIISFLWANLFHSRIAHLQRANPEGK